MRLLNNRKGFTLIEVLLVLVIVGMLVTVLGSIYVNQHQLFNRNNNIVSVQEEMNRAFDHMSQMVRQEGSITVTGNRLKAGNFEYTIVSERLVAKNLGVNPSVTAYLTSEGMRVSGVFSQDASSLIVTVSFKASRGSEEYELLRQLEGRIDRFK